ncbi:hypothetical protein AAG570_001134 [Ranatra chinensis]|uniref:Laminin N-terminal domain-containing protein n=1 Tax=Ranatra chinensis TaxID=642074 RepID=A0ABD0YXF2_9HEMI
MKHSFSVTLYPEPFNLAVGGVITSNATCGEDGPETWCRLRGHHQCGVCDSRSQDKGHPPQAAIDNRADTWWQSPTLHSGQQYNYVTLTLDLRQVSTKNYFFYQH